MDDKSSSDMKSVEVEDEEDGTSDVKPALFHVGIAAMNSDNMMTVNYKLLTLHKAS